jgi:hypothetical protein
MTTFGKRLDGPGGHRAAARKPVLLRAALHTLTASRPVTLFDVSRTGARLSMPVPLASGQPLWLTIPPSEIFATVVWIEGDHCGIHFDDPLDDDELATLQAKGKVVMIHGLTADEQLGAEDWQTNLAR